MLTTSANPKAGLRPGRKNPFRPEMALSLPSSPRIGRLDGAGAELAMAAKSKEPPREALTFDDVLLKPGLSDTLPSEADIRSRITRTIALNIPIIASAMDTVTESQMAIAMAQSGGLGGPHPNKEPDQQAARARPGGEVRPPAVGHTGAG